MIGTFIIDKNEDIAFAHLDAKERINSFLYATDARMVTAHYADGTEEAFTSEIEGPIHDALVKAEKIAVGRFDDDNKITEEYVVELKVV